MALSRTAPNPGGVAVTSSDWIRVRDLFERALDERPADAVAWLNQEPELDSSLKAEVISLLEHHERAGAFLSDAAGVAAELLEDPPLIAGRVLGPYTIVREAGRGGMGRVYVATDSRLGRTVALKAVRRPTDSAQRERLRREARAAAALAHPGICTVFALEELDGDLFIASEFIEGRTLRQETAGGPRPTAGQALEAARQIVAALAAAHGAGIVHGDLKPDNVMRSYDGRLKILDFGLARSESAGAELASASDAAAAAGTPGYMAPEQLNGRPRDARADVFAFGVLMYEYVSGVHPFAAPTPLGMATQVLEHEPPPLLEVRPDLPPALRTVIERCIRKAAIERFATAADIVQALATDPPTVPRARALAWWRAHQIIIVVLYAVASIAAWRIKEAFGGATTTVFLVIGIAASIAAVFRGHLLFTERVNRSGLGPERQRAGPVTMAIDLLMAAGLAVDGSLIARSAPLATVLTVALGVGLALARMVLEPSTTSAAFDDH
jgi:predicted Ser/Thr protein kinase